MKKLIKDINNLKKSPVKLAIKKRIKEFESAGKKPSREIFKELCFCLMTANFNAEKSIYIQEKIGKGFLNLSKQKLSERLRQYGHRFPNARAEYIYEARPYVNSIKKILGSFNNEYDQREWLVKNIKGFGYKEAGHFLRNIGCKNCTIIDFHIVDLLEKYKIIEKPKTLSRLNYLIIENKLLELGKLSNLNMAELDLYLWYKETGKILK